MVVEEYYVIKTETLYLTQKEYALGVYKCTANRDKAKKFLSEESARQFLLSKNGDENIMKMNGTRIVKVTTNEEDV